MATYTQLKTRVATDINRTALIDTEVSAAVQSAIDFYANEPFWFKESRNVAVTVDGTEYYDLPSNIGPSIQSINITISGNKYPLERVGYNKIEEVYVPSTTYTGHPQVFAIYDEKIRLYPIPDASYTLSMSNYLNLDDLSASTDTNAWTTHGFELIRYRAGSDLWLNYLHNPSMSAAAERKEAQALANLKKKSSGIVSSNKIQGDL